MNPVRGAERNVADSRLNLQSYFLNTCDECKEDVVFDPFKNCANRRCKCIISWKGKMLGCNFVNSISRDALEGDFVENFRLLWNELEKIKTPQKCMKCAFYEKCLPCPGELEGTTGNPEEMSPYVCSLKLLDYTKFNSDLYAENC